MRDNRRHPQLLWYSEGEEGNAYHSAVVNSQWQKSIRIQGERLSGLGRKMVKSEPGFTTADVPVGQKKWSCLVLCYPESSAVHGATASGSPRKYFKMQRFEQQTC